MLLLLTDGGGVAIDSATPLLGASVELFDVAADSELRNQFIEVKSSKLPQMRVIWALRPRGQGASISPCHPS